jgi:hypothetical protein
MFELENPVEKKFGSFDETLAFVSEEKSGWSGSRSPVSGRKGRDFMETGCLAAVQTYTR